MKESSRIRFNPVTKEVEVAGTEKFVKTYFKKLQAMISGSSEKTLKPKAVKVPPVKKSTKELNAVKPHPPQKDKKATKKALGVKRVTNIDAVVGLIQGSIEGITTAELKERTGLAERQIWSIVNRAAKSGKIQKVKRGVYGVA